MKDSSKTVVWWSIDSVRQDHCSAYGYDRETTPNLDLMDIWDAQSNGTWSLPSVASIFTGAPPSEHGLTDQEDSLPTGSTTFPMRFRDSGYHTIGLIANPWVARRSNLDLGFQDFYNISEDGNLLKRIGIRDAIYFATHVRSVGGGFTTDPISHPTDWLMVSLARQKLNAAPDDRPTFLYLHTKGCHSVYHDYRPPPAWTGRVSESGNTRIDRYDDLLGWVDSQWPRLSEAIPDDAIVVVTSDHGEALGEQGQWGHDNELPILNQVPMFTRNIETEPGTEPVDHISMIKSIAREVLGPDVSLDPDIGGEDTTIETSPSLEGIEDRLEALGYR